MSFLDTLRKSLTPEMYTQVTDALGDDFDFDLVPRSRLNKVIKQRNELREQLAGKSQPQGSSDSDSDEDDVAGAGAGKPQSGQQSQVDIKALEKEWQAKQDKAVQDVKIQYAVLEKLRAANAIDAELILNGGLIDHSKVKVNEDGSLAGIDEMITDLQKNKAHLFNTGSGSKGGSQGTGKEGGEEPTGVATKEDFLKLSAEKQIAFKQSNPTMFQKFLEQ